MENFEDLLPRHKSDNARVEMIKKMERDKIMPLLPSLLEWVQDMNWPVAPSVLELLLTFPEEIVPHVQEVLSSDDDNWKWFILNYLVIELPVESRVQFKKYLTRVAERPTRNELAEEVNEIAKEILETI
ncbi:hypothetical protein BFZC1_08530 [Lysinibacillus fusiformis ZC1]|uniref:DUF5071 domain-containing protein n=1 Tax=Lysinibacillus capsici TaxID=2115968 RepID=UPI0001DA5512|nr:DUF5071 domain-containing protein [Lysinibacillus capsici]EFI69039.1 hypothetical protein BFZC1_08530 [Lysinibacillus fusiformis ZC1]EKU41864.1 hypothetical protein C518_3170 [Lysinibacillus fusiformis ZB2]MBU5252510.1 DUF5071 domain-containing protein [Lysinibacillus capsici]